MTTGTAIKIVSSATKPKRGHGKREDNCRLRQRDYIRVRVLDYNALIHTANVREEKKKTKWNVCMRAMQEKRRPQRRHGGDMMDSDDASENNEIKKSGGKCGESEHGHTRLRMKDASTKRRTREDKDDGPRDATEQTTKTGGGARQNAPPSQLARLRLLSFALRNCRSCGETKLMPRWCGWRTPVPAPGATSWAVSASNACAVWSA